MFFKADLKIKEASGQNCRLFIAIFSVKRDPSGYKGYKVYLGNSLDIGEGGADRMMEPSAEDF